MKRPASGTLLVIGFALVALGAIALNVYVNRGEGSLRRENAPPRKASPQRTVPRGDATPPPERAPASPDASVVAIGLVTASGTPFEGARVSAVSRARPAEPARHFATSGKDGRFELGNLPPAPFHLKAEAPGWLPAWAEVGALGTSARVEGFVLELVPAGGIRGRVVAAGAPVAGAMVVAGNETATEIGGSLQGKVSSTSDGTYLLESVRPGRMTVAAFHPGAGFAAAVVDVAKDEVTTADLALAPIGRLRGRVVGPDGKPLAGANVSVIDPGDLDLLPAMEGASIRLLTVAGRIQSTDTGEDGRFELRTLMSRTPSLAVLRAGFASHSRKLEVSAGEDPPELEIRLELRADSRSPGDSR